MLPRVIEARHVRDYVVWLRFADGASGEVDLAEELWGPLFEPLRDADIFGQLRVELGTVVWPNGADFAPEFLYEQLRVNA